MLIDGKQISEKIELQLEKKIQALPKQKPALAFILVGENPASLTYIRMKKKKCKKTGIFSIDFELPDTISEKELLEKIQKLNKDPNVHGILVQLPLPAHIDTQIVLESVDPKKDIDGFHPINIGKLLLGRKDGFISCTPLGIHLLLQKSKICIEGKHVVILGRSNIVGKPLAALLMQKEKGANATVTIAHSKSTNLKEISKQADILIVAMGNPLFVKEDMVKEGAVVIDVGINRQDGNIVGDVDFEKVAPKCSHITPVPGGVGPMTIAALLLNTYISFQRIHGRTDESTNFFL